MAPPREVRRALAYCRRDGEAACMTTLTMPRDASYALRQNVRAVHHSWEPRPGTPGAAASNDGELRRGAPAGYQSPPTAPGAA